MDLWNDWGGGTYGSVTSINLRSREEELEGEQIFWLTCWLARRLSRVDVSLSCLTRCRGGLEAMASGLVSQGLRPFAVELLGVRQIIVMVSLFRKIHVAKGSSRRARK
jgi:hypothetical protein